MKRVIAKKIKLTHNHTHKRSPLSMGVLFGSLFALVGVTMIVRSFAAPVAIVDINFSALNSKPTYYHYEDAMMRHRKINTQDREALNEIGVKYERVFVRLDQAQPTAPVGNNWQPNFDGNPNFGFGETWMEEMNDANVSPWLTQEVDAWKAAHDWYIEPPLSTSELTQYEELWYRIVKHTKMNAPLTEFIEMMNEPDLTKFRLKDDDRINLWVSNARVVNRINSELGLPNATYGTKLKAGGPSFIEYNVLNGTEFQAFLDGVYAKDMASSEDLKPSFFSYHNLQGGKNPSDIKFLLSTIRARLGDSRFGGYWDGIPIWNTAYAMTSSGANATDPVDNQQDPPAQNMAQTAAGLAASHYYMMDSDVKFASVFTQTNYLDYTQSVLLPENISSGKRITYYAHGKKTPEFNLFHMMEKVEGQRVPVSFSGPSSLTNTGEGVGALATKTNNKVFVHAWNYSDSATTGFESDATFKLSGLSNTGIADDETASIKMYVINKTTSNIGHGDHSQDDLKLVSTSTLARGATREISKLMDTNEVVLYEITGNNDGSGGGGDTTRPTVSWTSPDAHSTIRDSTTLIASASDETLMGRVEFFADGVRVGQDSNVADNTYSITFNSTSLSNGNHNFMAVAHDVAGNSETSASITINVDNTPLATCNSASVTPPTGNLAPNYSYEVVGSGLNPIGTATYSWPSGDAKSGACAAKIVSVDAAGSETSQRYVTPVNAIPVTAGNEYDLSGWIKATDVSGDATIRVNFWAGPGSGDFISGSSSISNRVSGTTGWTVATAPRIAAPAGAQFARIELRLAGSGTALFDDVALIPTVIPPIDNIPPEVTVQTPGGKVINSSTFSVTATATDNSTGIARVELRRVDTGATIATDTTSPYALPLPISTLPNGDYQFRVHAFDGANNPTQSSAITLHIRNPDIDRSTRVDYGDLSYLVNSWNQSIPSRPTVPAHDLDNDNVIGYGDLSVLINNWTR